MRKSEIPPTTVRNTTKPGRVDDVSEIFQLREYRPGDRIQSVHWKRSAAREDLIVGSTACRWQGRWRCCWICGGRKGIWTISWKPDWPFPGDLWRRDAPHYVAWMDAAKEDVSRLSMETEEDLYTLTEMLYRAGWEYQHRKPAAAVRGKIQRGIPDLLSAAGYGSLSVEGSGAVAGSFGESEGDTGKRRTAVGIRGLLWKRKKTYAGFSISRETKIQSTGKTGWTGYTFGLRCLYFFLCMTGSLWMVRDSLSLPVNIASGGQPFCWYLWRWKGRFFFCLPGESQRSLFAGCCLPGAWRA